MSIEQCLVCGEMSEYNGAPDFKSHLNCPRCGMYSINGDGCEVELRPIEDRQRSNISGWLRENQNVELDIKKVRQLLILPTPSFHERADKFLKAVEKKTEYSGQGVNLGQDLSAWISFTWCINEGEYREIRDYVYQTKRISAVKGDVHKITPEGWAHLEKLKESNPDSQQGFVAMWFDESMKRIYEEAIHPGIYAAGYKPHKVDLREHNNKICDEIVAQIRRSRFVVADFTRQRGGVYYEAGFAQGLGLEVIWTCRKDDMANLHFDIRQYNCIDWDPENLPDFKKRLQNRIESVLGRGKHSSNDLDG